MDCAALLLEHRSSILDESYTVLERSHVHHYEAAGEEFAAPGSRACSTSS